MKDTNEWISEDSIVWKDPTICSEEERIHFYEDELRRLAVETCLFLPEYISDPFLEFIDFIEKSSWKHTDVIQFRHVVMRIIHILEPVAMNVIPEGLNMSKWYSIDAFSETWKAKVEDIETMWRSELVFLLN